MKSFNRVQLVGWLGMDLNVMQAKNGAAYAKFKMATHNFRKTTEGKTIKKTNWHTVRIWDAAIIDRYRHDLIKGSHVMIEGSINYRDYTNREGRLNHIAEIRATHLVDLDR